MVNEDIKIGQRKGKMVATRQRGIELKTSKAKRKDIKEGLKLGERQFQALIENAQDAIVIVDPDVTIRYESPSMGRITGRKAEERIGKNPLDFCYPDDIDKLVEEFILLLENKIPVVHMEIRLQHKNGELLDIELTGTNLIDDPSVGGIVLNLRDITERKRADKELRASEEKLRRLFDSIEYAIVISDLEGKIIDENDAAVRYQGYNHKEEVIGKNGFQFVSRKDRPRAIQQGIRLVEKGYGSNMEAKFVDRDGREYDAEASASMLRDDSGNPVGFVSITKDITERKRSEEELTRLSNALRMVNDSIVISDLQAKIVEVNEATLRMYGTEDKTDLIGKNSYDLIALEDREKAIASATTVLEKGYVQNQEYHIITKDGGTVLVEMNTAVMKDVDGKPTGFVAASRDITERRRVEDALQESEERFRSLVENAPYMIIISNREGKILFINYTTSGYTAEDTIGTSIYNYISVEYHDEVRRSVNRVFESGEPDVYRITGAGPDGTISWYSTLLGPIKRDGHVVAVTHIASDITEHIRAGLRLWENEERLIAFMESATDGFTIWDSELNLVEINRAAIAPFPPGTQKEDMIGKNLRDLLPGDGETGKIKQYLEVIKTGEPFLAEGVVLHPIFGSIIVDVRAFKVGDGLGIIASDVTERNRVEEELRESQEKLRTLFDTIGVGITVVDLAGNIVDANDTVLRMKGYSREDVIGRFGLDFVAERDRVRATDGMVDFLKGQEERNPPMEYALIKKDGSEMPCEATASLLHDGSGNLVGFISVEQDITERKKAEKALRESEERFRALTESTSDLIWEVDLDGVYTYASPKVNDLLGYKPEEIIGKTPFDLMPPKEAKRIEEAFRAIVESQMPFVGLDNINIHKDGRLVVLESNGVPFFSDDGRLCGYRGIDRDITERKKAEEELQRYSERLRAMAAKLSAAEEDERRRLSQELHDQVGQYLTALSINLSRASNELSDWLAEPACSILVDSQSIVERMSEIIRDVMADLRPPVIEDYGLVAALRWYAERFTGRTGINIKVQGEEPSPRLSSPYESSLFRIAQEVLTNVAKHSEATKVSINVAVKGETLRLVIKDNGIGLNTTEVDIASGQRGWGIIIMGERARSMGGSFNIESRPGHGTCVTVEVGL